MATRSSSMKYYYFTYGANHLDSDGRSLGNYYTLIKAFSEEQARMIIMAARGTKWCTSYTTEEAAGIKRFNLKSRTLEEVTIPVL